MHGTHNIKLLFDKVYRMNRSGIKY
jgi:hypothetical protein